ncbi:hypothetical protein G9A89_013015 [Geosiphon pyriformis]|nr:hypothetical protein G9A89_013015 [Geosiphon pyriformis]
MYQLWKEAIHYGHMYWKQQRIVHHYQILLQTLCTGKIWTTKTTRQIAQAIFLSLVQIPQLAPVTTQEELGLTAQRINEFGSSRKENIIVNFMEEDSDQNQALVFEANLKICLLADITNLYLPAKAYKHFRILIYNPTKDIIEILKGTLIGFISPDIQNLEKPQLISDFVQLFLFCNITSQILLNQYADVFASKNEFGCTNIIKHQIDTRDARPIKQQTYRILPSGDNLIKQKVQ